MSIIYNALQKTQQNRQTKRSVLSTDINFEPPPPHSEKTMHVSSWLQATLLIVLFICMIAGIFVYIRATATSETSTAPNSPTILATPMNTSSNALSPSNTQTASALNDKLVLTGVIIANQVKTALINNQRYQLGDMLNGMKVVYIDFDKVKLQNGKHVIELQVAS